MKWPMAGDTLYDVSTQRMVNTALRSVVVFEVRVTMSKIGDWVEASWNGNVPHKYHHIPSSWRRTKPYLVLGMCCSYRLATKAERTTGEIKERELYFLVKAREK